MNSYFANPLEFLLTTLIGLYILAVMLRFLLGLVRADFYNPVSQFLVRVTNPPLVPMRKLIPTLGKFDTAAVVLMLLLQLLSLGIVVLLHGVQVSLFTLLSLTVLKLVMMVINVFLVAIIVQVVLSWVSPGTYSPVNAVLYSLTNPVLQPFRRIIPPLSGIDLSPLFALIALQVARMLILPLLG